MSDNRSGEGMVLNWRGPLLAAGIFAAVFAILLLMAHQNESKTSDMGSSLREDPYGTSLLFDSYGRAGYQVKRSQDEDSLSDQNASRTTAFFIGGDSFDDWKIGEGKLRIGEKFRGRLEDFLARGGRVVLVAPTWKLKSESQGWEVENKWEQTATGVSTNLDLSRSRANAGGQRKDVSRQAMPHGSNRRGMDRPVCRAPWRPMQSLTHPYMFTWQCGGSGNGELIAASQESFLLNEAIKTHPNPVLLDFLAGGRPVIWVDETLHGLHQDRVCFGWCSDTGCRLRCCYSGRLCWRCFGA